MVNSVDASDPFYITFLGLSVCLNTYSKYDYRMHGFKESTKYNCSSHETDTRTNVRKSIYSMADIRTMIDVNR